MIVVSMRSRGDGRSLLDGYYTSYPGRLNHPAGTGVPRGRAPACVLVGGGVFEHRVVVVYSFPIMRIVELDASSIEETVAGMRAEISSPSEEIERAVKEIVGDVRTRGDAALFALTSRFDGWEPDAQSVGVSPAEMAAARDAVPGDIVADLQTAAARIKEFHGKKRPVELTFTDTLGNELGWVIRPLATVGIYVPGGKAAYPSTVLMTAIPALVAGVERVVIVTPAPGGEINPTVLAAADIAGVDEIYKVGGAQAVAALAYGTESVPRVDKIVGPGNIYVALAKRLVFGQVDIDMIAGPSEVLIIADGSSPASWVAADLLAQAEHDELAVPMVVTTSLDYAREVCAQAVERAATLPRSSIALASLKGQGMAFVVSDLDEAVRVANTIAPEHLEICTADPKALLPGIRHAGAIFLGTMSTEAFGDYVAGPSHVLPTGGAARFSSPLGVHDFIRMPSVISISERGFGELSGSVMNLAYSEGLEAHALSVKVRTDGE